jgi:hypothetical protein
MRKVLPIGLTGGLHTELDPLLLPPGASPDLRNVIVADGMLKVRKGQRLKSPAPVGAAGGIRALAEYHNPAMTPATQLLAGIGNTIYATDTPDQQFSEAAAAFNTTVSMAHRVRMQQFKAGLYLVDGESPVKQLYGSDTQQNINQATFGALGAGDGKFTTEYTGGMAIDSDGTLYLCDQYAHRVQKWATDEGGSRQFLGWYGYAADEAGLWHAAGSSAKPAASADGFDNPLSCCLSGEWLLVGDDGNLRIAALNLSTQVVDFTVTAPAGTPDGSETAMLRFCDLAVSPGGDYLYALELVVPRILVWSIPAGGNPYSVSIPNTLHMYNADSLTVDDAGYIYLIMHNPVNHFSYISKLQQSQPLALSEVNRWLFTMAVCSRIRFFKGQLYIPITSEIHLYTTDGTYTGRIEDLVDNVSGLAIGEDGAIIEGIPQATITEISFTPTTQQVVESLLDLPAPSTMPTVTAISGSTFAAGDYDCCYTYSRYVDSTTFDEGIASPVYSLHLAAASNLHVVAPVDVGAELSSDPSDQDHIYIYIRGGNLGTAWWRVKDIPYTGETSMAADITAFDLNAANLDPYIQRPPAACSLLCAWQGRMVYAKGDTLYFSNWDDPEHVPQDVLLETPATYGGWVRIGEDGGAITGLGQLGSYLVIFKQHGVWLTQGDISDPSTFAIVNISSSHGCLAHETIQQLDGMLLAWAERHTVAYWDGQQFGELGQISREMPCPVAALVAAKSDNQHQLAFAVYDQREKRYLLTFPDEAEPAHRPQSQTLAFDLRTGSWSRWTNQPGGAALATRYSLDRDGTPGPDVIAGDRLDGSLFGLGWDDQDELNDGFKMPVDWYWNSKVFDAPFPGHYQTVAEIDIYLSAAPAPRNFLSVALYPNGISAGVPWHELPINSTDRLQQLRWYPAAAQARTFQIGLYGSSSEPFSPIRLEAIVSDKGAR